MVDVLTDPDEAFGLPTWPSFWRAEGGFDDAHVEQWDDAMAHARAGGGLVHALTYFVVSGVAP